MPESKTNHMWISANAGRVACVCAHVYAIHLQLEIIVLKCFSFSLNLLDADLGRKKEHLQKNIYQKRRAAQGAFGGHHPDAPEDDENQGFALPNKKSAVMLAGCLIWKTVCPFVLSKFLKLLSAQLFCRSKIIMHLSSAERGGWKTKIMKCEL